MRAVDIIRKKRDGHELTPEEIDAFVAGAISGSWEKYQLSALLMAIVLRGMTAGETAALTTAMVRSGSRLDFSDFPGPRVDKHSTGGVGDKTTMVLVPLAAACGLLVPKMSGRSLGHSGGTLDKLEAIPGFRVHLTVEEFRAALRKVGCVLAGQTAEIAPADKILYALRDVTATVESVPLITASVMCKKIAEGIDALVLDVKCGRGAFMKTPAEARALAESLTAVGRASGVRTEALITAMEAPLGRAVGNALEVIEAIETLKGQGPADLEMLSVRLAARMLCLGDLATSEDEAENRVREALTSGRGLEKFRQVIEQQGGDPRVLDDYDRLPTAPHQILVEADRPGYIAEIDAQQIGQAAMVLGAGRDRTHDVVDPGVGVVVRACRGDQVRPGDPLAEVHYRDAGRLEPARGLIRHAFQIVDVPPTAQPLLLDLVQ